MKKKAVACELAIDSNMIESIIYSNDSLIRLLKDGNKIVALLGEDLQAGFSGFGNTIQTALKDLIKNMNKTSTRFYISN